MVFDAAGPLQCCIFVSSACIRPGFVVIFELGLFELLWKFW